VLAARELRIEAAGRDPEDRHGRARGLDTLERVVVGAVARHDHAQLRVALDRGHGRRLRKASRELGELFVVRLAREWIRPG